MQESRESASPLASGPELDGSGNKKEVKTKKKYEEHGTRTHNLGFAGTEEIEIYSVV